MSNWVLECQKKNKRVISQGGQDGILTHIFENLETVNSPPYYVEFGYKGFNGANTENLRRKGWIGLLMDGSREDEKINLHKEFITSENVCSLFEKYGVPEEPDYVSIDIDSCDLWVFDAITKKYRPRVVSVEFNCNYPLSDAITFPNNPKQVWRRDRVFGASLKALKMVGDENGYDLVAYTPYLDLFFIRSDLIKDQEKPSYESFSSAVGIAYGGRVRGDHYNTILDYEVYKNTGSEEQAREAAKRVHHLIR